MSEEALIKHCSPTLAGLKTGNMFTYPYKNADEMRCAVRHWNKILSRRGLRILPLRYFNNKALIYLYRPSDLSKDLQNAAACNILRKCGYGVCAPNICVAKLAKRMAEYKEFPHEIGLFLGYPPEDVRGFIENKAGHCKYVGYWKVYGDEAAAKKTFAKYRKCTQIYTEQHTEGKNIERLIVPARKTGNKATGVTKYNASH